MSNANIIIVEEINGIEIVKGIDKLQIDPVSSKSIIEAELTLTDEFAACKIKSDEMNEKFTYAGSKLKQSSKAKVQGNKTLSLSLYKEYKQSYDEAIEIMREVRKLLPAVKQAKKELFKTHAVYFEPNKRERIKTDAEINAIKGLAKNLSVNKLIKSDGTLINNYSGMIFFHKDSGTWIKTIIDEIGINKPAGSKLFTELSETDIPEVLHDVNVKRISLLSTSEKVIENQEKLSDALVDSINMRSGLEIQNDPEALTKSQQWYNDEVIEINTLYQ